MAETEQYRVEVVRQEDDDGIGLYDLNVYLDEASSSILLGSVVICDSRRLTEEKETGKGEFSPAVTYVEYSKTKDVEPEKDIKTRDMFDLCFEFLAGLGVETVTYCVSHKESPKVLKKNGFSLERVDNGSWYPVYHYIRELDKVEEEEDDEDDEYS
ncbi:MAG: hypothetical protein K5989_11990 [Lachnospiraceae bacterium]|nr:hypothetical protein [Lachnospiraceae bacterium]